MFKRLSSVEEIDDNNMVLLSYTVEHEQYMYNLSQNTVSETNNTMLSSVLGSIYFK